MAELQQQTDYLAALQNCLVRDLPDVREAAEKLQLEQQQQQQQQQPNQSDSHHVDSH